MNGKPRKDHVMAQQLFFISAQDSNGESLDWFVRAASKEHALKLWEQADMVMDAGGDYANLHVFLVPPVEGEDGVIDWPDDLA